MLRIKSIPFEVEQGQAIPLKGTLMSYQGGATITINGKNISDFGNPKIDLVLTDPNGNQISKSLVTDIYGNFTYEFRPNLAGIWYATASYNGSSYFFPSTSNVISISVRCRFPWTAALASIALLSLVVVPRLLWKHKYENEAESKRKRKQKQRTKLSKRKTSHGGALNQSPAEEEAQS